MLRRTHLLTALAALTLAACGDETEDPSVPAAGDRDQAELAFARCMRGEGIDVPDPSPDGGPRRIDLDPEMSPKKVQAATETCRDKTGGGPRELSDDQQQELQDRALEFARCMRQNGVDIPDPQVNGKGGAVLIGPGRGGAAGPRINSAAFKKAEAACRKLMPGPPGAEGSQSSDSGSAGSGATLEVSP